MKKGKAKVAKTVAEPEADDQEFVEAWMDERGLRCGGEWVSLAKGWLEKEFCEVRLRDGSVFGPCWPNAGKFIRIGSGAEIADVTHVRYYKPDEHVGRDDEHEPEEE